MNDGSKPYFAHHVFVCGNHRPAGHPRGSCGEKGSEKLRDYMKVRAKEMGLGGVRINAAGCLDRCEHGPVAVIYPRGIWCKVADFAAVDRLLADDILSGRPVADLMLPNEVAPLK